MTPRCPYCLHPAELVTGDVLYPHRPDLRVKNFWRCLPCRAHVGCHPVGNGDGTKPMGGLANAALRQERMAAHAAFDDLWRNGEMSRRQAYKWLASMLDLPYRDTHIGEFDATQCRAVVAAVRQRMETPNELREG